MVSLLRIFVLAVITTLLGAGILACAATSPQTCPDGLKNIDRTAYFFENLTVDSFYDYGAIPTASTGGIVDETAYIVSWRPNMTKCDALVSGTGYWITAGGIQTESFVDYVAEGFNGSLGEQYVFLKLEISSSDIIGPESVTFYGGVSSPTHANQLYQRPFSCTGERTISVLYRVYPTHMLEPFPPIAGEGGQYESVLIFNEPGTYNLVFSYVIPSSGELVSEPYMLHVVVVDGTECGVQ